MHSDAPAWTHASTLDCRTPLSNGPGHDAHDVLPLHGPCHADVLHASSAAPSSSAGEPPPRQRMAPSAPLSSPRPLRPFIWRHELSEADDQRKQLSPTPSPYSPRQRIGPRAAKRSIITSPEAGLTEHLQCTGMSQPPLHPRQHTNHGNSGRRRHEAIPPK